jgi:hypothetical protein
VGWDGVGCGGVGGWVGGCGGGGVVGVGGFMCVGLCVCVFMNHMHAYSCSQVCFSKLCVCLQRSVLCIMVKKVKTKATTPCTKSQDRKDMMGYLKFTPTSKKASGEAKALCIKGLQVYESLPPNKKGAFIDRWKATKDSKNMGWVKDFEEEVNKEKEVTRSKVCGLYTRQLTSTVAMCMCKQMHACLHA